MIEAREKVGANQAKLAEKIGIRQPALSRLEGMGYRKVTLEPLKKIAGALNQRLIVKMVPKKNSAA